MVSCATENRPQPPSSVERTRPPVPVRASVAHPVDGGLQSVRVAADQDDTRADRTQQDARGGPIPELPPRSTAVVSASALVRGERTDRSLSITCRPPEALKALSGGWHADLQMRAS